MSSPPPSPNLFGSPFSAEMDSSESPFSNLDLWCGWNGDVTGNIIVSFEVEVWCTPNDEITVLDTSHPCVTQILFSDITPAVNFEDLEYFDILRQDLEPMPAETRSCLVPEQKAQVPVTPEKQAVPMTSEQDTSHATLHPGPPNGQTDTLTPSDSGSMLRNEHTPAGFPPRSKTLDAFMASFFRCNDSPLTESEDELVLSVSRKRTAKAASLPDSVTDDERSFGGEKLDDESRARLKRKQSPVSSTPIPSTSSTAKHTRERSSIPRPVSVASQAHPEPTKIPLPTDSLPVLDAKLRRFENSVSPVEKDIPVHPVQFKDASVAEAVSGDTTPPLASPSTRTSPDVSHGDAGKTLKNGPDMEKLSTAASAGSPCDMKLNSESVNASFGGIPTQGTFFVRPPTPPDTIPRPRLVLVNQLFQVKCPSDLKSASYKVSVHFVVRLQTSPRLGWHELVLPGLPRLKADDRGYVHLRFPPELGLECRTMLFVRHTMDKGCLFGQFRPCKTKLVIPLRPTDPHFHGFLRDFKINQNIRSKVTADKHDSTLCIIKYTAVCSLDLIERTFWAEQCGFYLYIRGGPAGEYTYHLEKPKAKFNTIQLTLDAVSEVGMARLLVLCTPSDLDMFVIKWEMRLPRAEAGNWMPRITALPHGYQAEEWLVSQYLEAEEAEQEIVGGKVKSEIVTPETSNVVTPERSDGVTPKESNGKKTFMPLVMKIFWLLMALFLMLQPVAYSIGLYDGVLSGVGQGVRNTFCENSKLCVPKSPWEILGLCRPELIPPVPVALELTVVLVSKENVEPGPSPVPEEINRRPPEPARRRWTPVTLRDHIDYWLGWKGPLPHDGL